MKKLRSIIRGRRPRGNMAIAAIAIAPFLMSGSCAFYHSDATLSICNRMGWSSGSCGSSLCYDWYQAYPTTPCPDWVRYGDAPR